MARARTRGAWLDYVTLFVVQPLIAVLAVAGLWTSTEDATEVTQPLFIWGGVILLFAIFIESIWSFATRYSDSDRLRFVWAKMASSALCTLLAFASAYKHLGLIDAGRTSHEAGAAFYFSITAWTTVGYGDVIATPAARPFAAAEALIGLLYNSGVIGLILFAITSSRRRSIRPTSDDHE